MSSDDAGLARRCERFLFDEAELLDDGEFERWLGLFTQDAVYWLPVDTSRREPRGGLNIIYDDRSRLEDRVRRLRSGYSHTEMPPSKTSHLIANLRIIDSEDDRGSWLPPDPSHVLVVGRMIVAQSRRERTNTFHARVVWTLLRSGAQLAIRGKRIDLLDADGPLPALTFLL